jgi:hypothetical protein
MADAAFVSDVTHLTKDYGSLAYNGGAWVSIQ